MLYLVSVLRQAASLHNEAANAQVDAIEQYEIPYFKNAPQELLSIYYSQRETAITLWQQCTALARMGLKG